MVIRIKLLALAGLLCLLGISPVASTSPHATGPQLSSLTNQRIAFLGGTLISRMEQYGYLETALTAAWADQDITFRNLGWPGDDILGTARGEFGSKRNTRSWRPPTEEEGVAFQIMMDHVSDANPTTILVGYGNETAFFETDTAFEHFQEHYQTLLEALNHTGANLILLTPIPHCQPHSETTSSYNNRLQSTAAFVKAFASKQGHQSIDVFGHFTEMGCSSSTGSLYDPNGIHLNESGYLELSRFIAVELGIESLDLQLNIDAQHDITEVNGGDLTNVAKIKDGVRFDFRANRLMAPWEIGNIHSVSKEGLRQVKIDGRVWFDNVEVLDNSPFHTQFEKLRQLIIEKNQFHRDKMRPLNLAYIYLFRRHEMGHLSHEIEDLEELIEGHEQVIANLKKPAIHRFELKHVEDWRAPRDYPDHEVPLDVPKPDIAEELAAFTLAEGLEINLFSGDALIANPINLNWDTKGRAWIATSSTYPHLRPGDKPNDRIVILEDRNQDGVADTAKVFAEGFLVPHSVMPVEGGAYVASTTELLFLADHDGDDIADERRVVFDGFGNADVHHMLHDLTWAPWGDLHFVQSIYINSFVETAYGPRRLNGSGVWQFRPETERLEVYARGMTNPWGFTFDYWGQSFATDGAGGSGPHFQFPGSKHGTAVGAHRVLPGLIPGKPKNTAAEFVSGRHLPQEWIGSLLANDYRANRMVRYILSENGSGYEAEEAETVLHSTHRSFRPVDLKLGPDGALYVVDWYNPIIDHGEVDFYHPLRDRSHGRIWRITAKNRPTVDVPAIAGASIEQLFELLKVPESYTRQQAKRELILHDHTAVATHLNIWAAGLDAEDPAYEHHKLEAGWLSITINQPHQGLFDELLSSKSANIRAAATRMVGRAGDTDHALPLLARLVNDSHPQVRLEAVNALRDLEVPDAATIALRALEHPVDDNLAFALELTVRDLREQWIPSLLTNQKVFDGNEERLRYALLEVTDSRVTSHLLDQFNKETFNEKDAQRAVGLITSLGTSEEVEAILDKAASMPHLLSIMANHVSASSSVPMNAADLSTFLSHQDERVREAAIQLVGSWQVNALAGEVTNLAMNTNSLAEQRVAAQAIAQMNAMGELQNLMSSTNASGLRAAALAAWAEIAPREAAPEAIHLLTEVKDNESSSDIINAFLATDEGVEAFRSTLENAQLPESTALEGIRVVRSAGRYMGDMIEAFRKAGNLNEVAQDMSEDQRRLLITQAAQVGDAQRGRIIYNRANLQCNNCHLVNGEGKHFGPDLSSLGAYMTPQAILESMLNPNTDIKQGYETVLIKKKDNSIVSGLLQRETDDATLLRLPGGMEFSVSNDEIDSVENSEYSLMPAALTTALRWDELVDLMRYLTELDGEN